MAHMRQLKETFLANLNKYLNKIISMFKCYVVNVYFQFGTFLAVCTPVFVLLLKIILSNTVLAFSLNAFNLHLSYMPALAVVK